MFNFDYFQTKEKILARFGADRKKYLLIGFGALLFFLTLLYLGPLEGLQRFGFFGLGKEQQKTKAEALRGAAGDLWADVVIGQPNFGELAASGTVGNKLDTMGGAVVDTNSSPQRLYIYDSRHHRILGWDWDQLISGTNNNLPATKVIGQPDMFTAKGNGDSGFQNFPEVAHPSASSLRGMPENQVSTSEGSAASSMAVDSQGNLFIFDTWNHRVLKYNDPFGTDSVADEIWGQNDFSQDQCNKGQANPDATSLCYGWGPNNDALVGVDIDSGGNLWVADNQNNRVIRFPPGSKTADLVLGQPDFTSKSAGNGLNQLSAPSVVRINGQGQVYVADEVNSRVLRFSPPFTNGMAGELFASGFGESGPTGIRFDRTELGKVWLLNADNQVIELWDEQTKTRVANRDIGQRGNANLIGAGGGRRARDFAVDKDGNVFVVPGYGELAMQGLLFKKGQSQIDPIRHFNNNDHITSADLGWVTGVAVADNQLIVSDSSRLLFWNDPASLTDHKPADGYASGLSPDRTISSFKDGDGSCCSAIAADQNHHLWVAEFADRDYSAGVIAYNLPLTTGVTPVKTIRGGAVFRPAPTTLSVLGGGTINIGIIWGIVPTANSEFLWLSDSDNSRVIRIRDPLTSPVVDVILGQTSYNSNSCNQGSTASPTSLCYPGFVTFDRLGNLWVSDHSLEIRGNNRLLMFNQNLFPTNNTSVIYAPAASKIFPDIATWQPAFDSQNHMAVAYNGYFAGAVGEPNHRFIGFYNDPLGSSTSADGFFKDFGTVIPMIFDANDNLYAGDWNRGRLIIYKNPFNNAVIPSPSPDQSPDQSLLSPTPTPSPEPSSNPLPSVDSTPPTVSIKSPENGAVLERKTSFNLSADASDDVGVSRVEFLVNDSLVCKVENSPYECQWKVPAKPNTNYKITVTAFDGANNNAFVSISVKSSGN